MLDTFRQYITRRDLVTPNDHILIAVSGGRDSMTLLHLLQQTHPSAQLGVAHCNFGLRGNESDSDQALVQDTCQKYGIPLHLARFDTEEEARRSGDSIQMAARRLRYQWFDSLCDQHNYQKIAIAHHGDDSVETFFINLLRGTGLRGLTGISDLRGRIIRPLLFARRDQITAYAAQHGIPYRDDSTNTSLKYLRNRLRHQIIPQLASSGNSFAQTMEGNLTRLQQAQQYIDHHISHLRQRAWDGTTLDLTQLSSDTLGFELYELLSPYGFAPETLEDLAHLIRSHAQDSDTTVSGKQFIAEQWTATLDRRRLLLSPRTVQPFREELIAADDSRIEWLTVSQLPATLATPPNIAYLTADALQFPLRLRRWQEGDWFIPLGMCGQKKVSDFLIDIKMPLTEKTQQGVLLSGSTIIWLTHQRIDDRYKVTQSARKIIRITLF